MENEETLPPPNPSDFSELSAGFWIRAGAYAIDAIISSIAVGLAGAALSYAGVPGLLRTVFTFSASGAYFTCLPVLNGGQLARELRKIRKDVFP